MFKLKYIFLFCFLFISIFFDTTKLSAGLLPESVVQIEEGKYTRVQDLLPSHKLVTYSDDFENISNNFSSSPIAGLQYKKSFSNKAVLINLESRDGKRGTLVVGRGQLFYKLGRLDQLRPKLLRGIKEKNREFLKILLRKIWVKAKDLKVGDKIKGGNNSRLKVICIEHITLSEYIDFYEISLKKDHAFYLVNSGGHLVLSHNISFLATMEVGVLIGAAVGVVSHMLACDCANVPIKPKRLPKAAFNGIIFTCENLAAAYFTFALIVKLVNQYGLKEHEKVINSTIYAIYKKLELWKALLKRIAPSAETIQKLVYEHVKERVRKKNEDMHKTNCDYSDGKTNRNKEYDITGICFVNLEDLENGEFQPKDENIEIIHIEILPDANGNPIVNEHGGIRIIYYAKHRNK